MWLSQHEITRLYLDGRDPSRVDLNRRRAAGAVAIGILIALGLGSVMI